MTEETDRYARLVKLIAQLLVQNDQEEQAQEADGE